MTPLPDAADPLDWPGIVACLDAEGHAVLPGVLPPAQVRELTCRLDAPGPRSRTSLHYAGLGRGSVFPLGEDLPASLAEWRATLYRRLAPVANRWNERLTVDYRFPAELAEFLQRNRAAGQSRPLSHLNRLGQGDYLCLHQSLAGEHVFPLQVVALLSEPGRDFTGGEFVMTEQRPRMQSRPMVVPLARGDVAIIGTARRPFRGNAGWYAVNLRHAISRVRSGERIGLEMSFHDAP